MTKGTEMIAGAILFALILIVGIDIGGDALNHALTPPAPQPAAPAAEQAPAAAPEAPAPEVAAPEAAAPAADIEQLAPDPIAPLVAQASIEAGQAVAKPCAACHTFDEGGPNRVGPNLHGIVGRDIAALEGFTYSPILGTLPGEWTVEKLDAFLLNPKAAAPGTRMAYAGVRKAEDRAALIAYLRSLSPNAPPLE